MKKLLSILPMLLYFFANGQTSVYHPFPGDGSNWVYKYFNDEHMPTSLFTEYVIDGDTTIGISDYKKISVNSGYAGALREEDRIVYFVPGTSTAEYILYDFNLVLGDTIIHPFGEAVCSNDTVVIVGIDSVLATDGYHRHFFLSSSAEWIEGIGSIYYLLNPAQVLCVSGNDVLQCMISGGSFTYPAGTSSCVSFIAGQNNSQSDISIFPNPSNGSLTVDMGKSDIKEITLTDLLGNIVLRLQTNNQKKVIIDNLHSGTFILRMTDKNNFWTNRTIISCPR